MNGETFRMERFNISGDCPPQSAAAPQGPQGAGLAPDGPPATMDAGDQVRPKRPRGFARLDRRLLIEISRRGGKAAHQAGTAHEFTSEEARIAGRKGGHASHEQRHNRLERRLDVPHLSESDPRRR